MKDNVPLKNVLKDVIFCIIGYADILFRKYEIVLGGKMKDDLFENLILL